MKKLKSGIRQKSYTNANKKKSFFFNYLFQWYILNNKSPRSIHLSNEKNPKTSDEITYVQNYNTESIYFYHIQSVQ